MNQKNLQMAVFALSDDYPGLTPEALEKALNGIGEKEEIVLLTKKEVAKILRLDYKTVERMAIAGVFDRRVLTCRAVRITKQSVDKFISASAAKE